MPFLGYSLLTIGGLFLSHACYSAHEFTHLLSPNMPAAGASATLSTHASPAFDFTVSNLPTDITAEVLVSLFLLTMGIVLSAEQLKPIRWNEWAAQVEHGEHGPESRYVTKPGDTEGKTTEELGQYLYGGPSREGYGYLENGRRMGFFDVRARRKEFADKIRKGGEKDKQVQ